MFALNGVVFASWVSRIPRVRDLLDLSPGQLGVLLLALATGSLCGLPVAGALVQRWGAPRVVRTAVAVVVVGLVVLAAAAQLLGSTPVAAVGLAVTGLGIGVWDVAMNLQGAEVERRLERAIMPRFHAAFSLGTVTGAAGGAAAAALGIGLLPHLGAVLVLVAVGVLVAAGGFLPPEPESETETADGAAPRRTALSAWVEPRTWAIGLMVLALALTEGTANDWLAVALVDGYDVPEWAGAAGFAVFVSAMTAGRLVGPPLLDRHGRTRVLWSTMALAGVGVLLTVLAPSPGLAVVGILLWGAGASLGFPVGMSAAADDPARAAARVSVVSTIGYAAFLAGPPLLGFLADEVGTLRALLVVAVLLVPSALVVPAARERRRTA